MQSRRMLLAISFLAAACDSLHTVDAINPTIASAPIKPSVGALYWRLPKTVLDISATYTYKGCTSDAPKPPKLRIAITATVTPRGIPDDDLFADGTGPWVTVPVSDLVSFWQDRKLSITHNADGTLASIESDPVDNTAAIASAVFTSAAKATAISLGVPGAAGGAQPQIPSCNNALDEAMKTLERLQNELQSLPKDSKSQATDITQINALQKKLTITVPMQTIDPGVTAVNGVSSCKTEENKNAICADGLIAVISPEKKDLNAWVSGPSIDSVPFSLYISLDFSKAWPLILRKCGDSELTCLRHHSYIDHDTHFREPAYIPVTVVRSSTLAGDPDNRTPAPLIQVTGLPSGTIVPFAQFGVPRSIPLKAGIFQKFTTSLTFDQFGGYGNYSFSSGSSGAQAATALTGATSGANSIATERRTDPDTLKKQAELAKLKAVTDLATEQELYNTMQAKGQVP